LVTNTNRIPPTENNRSSVEPVDLKQLVSRLKRGELSHAYRVVSANPMGQWRQTIVYSATTLAESNQGARLSRSSGPGKWPYTHLQRPDDRREGDFQCRLRENNHHNI